MEKITVEMIVIAVVAAVVVVVVVVVVTEGSLFWTFGFQMIDAAVCERDATNNEISNEA
jgi:hypothetical protein